MKKNFVFFLSFLLLNLAARAQCTFSGSTSFCSGTTIGGGTWSSSNTAVATVDPTTGAITGISIGTATLTYTTSLGYITTAISITDVASVAAISGASSVCAGSTTNFSNTTPGGTWSSSNTAIANINSSGVVSGIAAGSATITYSVANTCGTSYVTQGITVIALPASITGTATACVGSTSALGNTATGGTWSSADASIAVVNATTGIVTGVAAGTATISYSTGCSPDATVSFVVASPTVAAITGAASVCVGSTTALTSATPSGTWTSSNTGVANVGGTGIVTGVATGSATITYSVTNACGTNYVTQGETVIDLPASITGSTTACTGTTSALGNTTAAGTWSSSNTAIANVDAATGVVTAVAGGTATISYSTGCGTPATTLFTVLNSPAAITGNTSICMGSTSLLGNTTTGGTWSSSNTAVANVNATTGLVTSIAAGTTTITYTAVCGPYATTPVTVNALPVINAGVDISVCASGTGILTGTGASTYTWAPATYLIPTTGSTVTAHQATPLTTSVVYTLTGTDINGCVGTDNVTVSYNSSASVFLASVDQIAPLTISGDLAYTNCRPGTGGITLSANPIAGAYTYSWTGTGTPNIACSTCQTTMVDPTSTSTYTVIVSHFGCIDTAFVRVIVPTGVCSPCTYFKVDSLPGVVCGTCGLQPFHTVINDITTPLSNGNYYLPNNAVRFAGSGTTTHTNCNFYIFENTGNPIYINDTSEVIFNHCHLNSPCGWSGLSVSSSSITNKVGRVAAVNGTLIENAGNGSSGGGMTFSAGTYTSPTTIYPTGYDSVTGAHAIITADGCIFNKNTAGINMTYWPAATVAPNILPLKVVNSIFTSADFTAYHTGSGSAASDFYPFAWPAVSTLKAITSAPGTSDYVYNPKYGIDDYNSTVTRSNGFGIAVRGGYTDTTGAISYKKYIIGDKNNPANSNLFCNVRYGVACTNNATTGVGGNFVVYNGIFKLKYNGTASFDYGIHFSNTINYKFLVGVGDNGSSSDTGAAIGNKFYNLTSAVKAYYESNGPGYNTFVGRNSTITTKNLASSKGYELQTAQFDKTIVNNNTISNVVTGVILTLTALSESYKYGQINISSNILSAASSVPLTGTSMGQAILVKDGKIGSITNSFDSGALIINNNRIADVYNGITFGSFTYKPFNVNKNYIRLANQSTSGLQTGIYCLKNQSTHTAVYNQIAEDSIKGPGYATPSLTISLSTSYQPTGHYITGIMVDSSGSAANSISVTCNHVQETNIGYGFRSMDTLQWLNNVMYKNKYGMYLFGSIGTQGGPTAPVDNWWEDDGSGWWTSGNGFPTVVSNATGGFPANGNSEIYVRNTTDNYPSNAARNLGDAVYKYTTGTSYRVVTSAPALPACTGQDAGGGVFSRSVNGDDNSISTDTNDQGYTLMPNPNSGTFTIKQDKQANCSLHIRFINTVGTVVYDNNVKMETGKVQLTPANLATGLYIVELKDSNGTRSVIKTNVQK